MKMLKKLLTFIIFICLGLAASLTMVKSQLGGNSGMDSLVQNLEAYKLKMKYPTLSGEQITKLSQQAPGGLTGLMKSLKSHKPLVDPTESRESSPPPPAELVRVESAQELNQTKPNGVKVSGTDAEAIVNGTDSTAVRLGDSTDGKEVYAQMKNQFGNQAAIERIMKLNVSNEIKNKILANYEATGALPEFLTREKPPERKPSSEDEDPTDPSTWK